MKASEGGSEGIITICILQTRRPSFIQVSGRLALHTVKPRTSPRTSKLTATSFPEPEETPALQLHVSCDCCQNLVLVYSEVKITKDPFIGRGLDKPECWD